MHPVRKAGPKKIKLRLGDPPLCLDFMREIMIVINAWKCYMQRDLLQARRINYKSSICED